MENSSSKKFNKPLNQWVEEEIPITINEVDFDGSKVTLKQKIEMQSQKTMYFDAPRNTLSCEPQDHYYDPVDKHTYRVKCRNCMDSKFLIPAFQDLVEGKIVSRQQ